MNLFRVAVYKLVLNRVNILLISTSYILHTYKYHKKYSQTINANFLYLQSKKFSQEYQQKSDYLKSKIYE